MVIMLGTCTIRKSVLYVCVFQTPAFPLFDIKKWTCLHVWGKHSSHLGRWASPQFTAHCAFTKTFWGLLIVYTQGKYHMSFRDGEKLQNARWRDLFSSIWRYLHHALWKVQYPKWQMLNKPFLCKGYVVLQGDYSCVRDFFSATGLPTIFPKKDVKEMGQRDKLTKTDIERVRRLYSCGIFSTLLTAHKFHLWSPHFEALKLVWPPYFLLEPEVIACGILARCTEALFGANVEKVIQQNVWDCPSKSCQPSCLSK